MPELAKKRDCTGCLACVDSCRHNAIDIYYNSQGLAFVKSNGNCINCGACERTCPIVHPVQKNKIEDIHCFGGWCKDDNVRINGASGGAFSAIAISFLEREEATIVYGANLSDNRVKHISITRKEDVGLLSNSKYIQSNTEGVYRSVLGNLKQGISVLFSGTPCQIAGLYGYLGKRHFDNLYTVELVCHGVSSYKALDLHLQLHHSKKIYSFRDKKELQFWYNSQLTTIEQGGKVVKMTRKSDDFYKIYSCGLLERRSCSNCQYSSLNRVADVTLADFWGGSFDQKEYAKGVSLIITNNQRGDHLIEHSDMLFKKFSSILNAIPSNPRLFTGFKFIQYHPMAVYPDFFQRLLPRQLWEYIVRNKMPWKLIWGFFKVMQKVYYRKQLNKTIKLLKTKIL